MRPLQIDGLTVASPDETFEAAARWQRWVTNYLTFTMSSILGALVLVALFDLAVSRPRPAPTPPPPETRSIKIESRLGESEEGKGPRLIPLKPAPVIEPPPAPTPAPVPATAPVEPPDTIPVETKNKSKRSERTYAYDICRGKGRTYTRGGRSWRCNR